MVVHESSDGDRSSEALGASDSVSSEFARQAEDVSPGVFWEFVLFLLHNKKWWLVPIVVVLFLLGLLVVFGSSGAVAPFIYSLF